MIDEISIGETGRAFLVSRDGILLAHPDKTRLFSKIDESRTIFSTNPSRKNGAEQNEMFTVFTEVGETGWIIGLEQSRNEILLPVKTLLIQSILCICVGTCFAILFSLILSKRFSRPIFHLVEGTRRVGAGDLDYQIPVHGHDEIANLSSAFNGMVHQLRERTQDLRKSEQEYRLLTNHVSDTIFSLDVEGCFIYVNKPTQNMTGYNLEDLLGKPVHNILTPESRNTVDQVISQFTDSQHEQAKEFVVEVIMRSHDIITIEVKLVRISDSEKKIKYYGVGRNVTERNRLQQQLLQTEKLSSIGELISGVAHEINNPLTGIMGFTELLLNTTGFDSETTQYLETVLNEADRAKRIIQNLLTFARKHQPKKTLCQINDIVNSVVEFRAYEMGVSNIETQISLDHHVPSIHVDPHQLRQVILNIVNNAIHALQDTNSSGMLKIQTYLVNADIHISIEDNGRGILPEHVQKIFDPFFTTKEIGKGTGLGLSISHGIIQEHGGAIVVKSTVGQGTRFTVIIPVETENLLFHTAQASEIDSPVLPVLTILIVDDEKPILSYLRNAFLKERCTVDTAENGDEAIQQLKEKNYDIVLTDLRMPGMNCWNFWFWIGANMPHLKNRLVFMTGDILNPDTQDFIHKTNGYYLKKPFTFRELKKLILRCIHR